VFERGIVVWAEEPTLYKRRKEWGTRRLAGKLLRVLLVIEIVPSVVLPSHNLVVVLPWSYGAPFLAGRDFSAHDQAGSRVAIINEAAARDCFGNGNPIGRHITLSHITLTKGEKTYEVVGVVGDAKYNDLEHPRRPRSMRICLKRASLVLNWRSARESIRPESPTPFAKPWSLC
jgi:hypothetical protein